jgi:hypothetical protein
MNSDIDRMLRYRNHFLFWQFIMHSFVLILLLIFNVEGSLTLTIFITAWNFIFIFNQLYKEFKFGFEIPLILYLLISLQNLVFSNIPRISDFLNGISLYFNITPLNDALALGTFAVSCEHFLILSGYYLISNIKLKKGAKFEFNILDSNVYFKLSVVVYFLVILFRLGDIFGLNYAHYSSVLVAFTRQGYLISLFLLVFDILLYQRNKSKLLFYFITSIEVMISLKSGMKSEIITPLMPYMIHLLIQLKESNLFSLKRIIPIIVVFAFIIGFVFPFVSIFRSIANKNHTNWKDVSLMETFIGYTEYVGGGKNTVLKDSEKSRGLNEFLARSSTQGANAWAITYTNKNGYKPQYLFYMMQAIIPRIIWPEKPRMIQGGILYNMSLGKDFNVNAEDQKTSITPGFFGGMYLSGGYILCIFACFIAGILLSKIWSFVSEHLLYNPISIWVFFTIIFLIFGDFESFNDGGLSFYALTLVYIILIKLTNKFFYSLVYQ